MSAHTKGQWVVERDPNTDARLIKSVGVGTVAVVFADDGGKEARLLAAAPELLAQAKAAADTFADLAQTFTVFGYPVAADACRVAEHATRASVAKAEGK